MDNLPEKKSPGDYAILGMKVSAAIIPVVGGAAVELLGLINTPLEKRKVAWLNNLSERLKKFEENHAVSLTDLQNDPEFITVFTQASQIALRNHEEEKLEALRNAVINTAAKLEINASLRVVYLSYIDLLSPWHLKILEYFNNPKGACIQKGIDSSKYSMGAPAALLEDCFPGLRGRRDLYDFIYADLTNKGLLSGGELHITMTGSGMVTKRTTQIGGDFLRFIRDWE